jgi:hypothetical protein
VAKRISSISETALRRLKISGRSTLGGGRSIPHEIAGVIGLRIMEEPSVRTLNGRQ